MNETVDVPVRFAIKARVAEIEELKSEGCSYKKIHAAMVELNILKCSYGAFVSAVHRLKQDARPKKEVPKNQPEWGTEKIKEWEAEKSDEYRQIYGDD